MTPTDPRDPPVDDDAPNQDLPLPERPDGPDHPAHPDRPGGDERPNQDLPPTARPKRRQP